MSKIDRKHEATGKGPHARHGHGPKDDDHKADHPGGHEAHHEKKKHAAWRDEFRDHDKNHNGKLSKSELKIPKAERRIYDHNHNGRIGKHEFKVGYRKIQRLDKNDDGHLSKHELPHHGHGHAHGHHGGGKAEGHHGHGGHGGGKAEHHGHHGGGHHGGPGGHHGGPGGHHGGPGGHSGPRPRHVNLDDSAPTGGPDRPQAPGSVHGDTDFTISSFNVLGSSHTAAGGNKPGMASGPARMHDTVQLLNQHGVDLVGFQEFQPDQAKEFQKLAGDKFGLYPGMKLGRGPNVNSIAWRKDRFDLVKADTIAIPYFGGHPVKMPVIRLRDKKTGQEFYIANFHNPADTAQHHGQQRFRDEATRREIALVNRLRQQTGLPVFITGDMNEKNEYYNRMTNGAPGMHASSGRQKNPGIDWIFGSPNVKFTRHVRDRSAKVRHASDHPMIVSEAHING